MEGPNRPDSILRLVYRLVLWCVPPCLVLMNQPRLGQEGSQGIAACKSAGELEHCSMFYPNPSFRHLDPQQGLDAKEAREPDDNLRPRVRAGLTK